MCFFCSKSILLKVFLEVFSELVYSGPLPAALLYVFASTGFRGSVKLWHVCSAEVKNDYLMSSSSVERSSVS